MSQTILHIDSSVRGPDSISRALTQAVVDRLTGETPDAKVVYRDLNAAPADHITSDWVNNVMVSSKDEDGNATRLAAVSDILVNEVKDADTIVIGMPIYNFNISSLLKSWIDQITRSNVTFRYTENGVEGLVGPTRAIVVMSSAATMLGAENDFASSYIRYMLGFLGITDVSFVNATGSQLDADKAQSNAKADIAALAA